MRESSGTSGAGVDDSRHEGPSNAGVVDDDAGRKYEDRRRPQDLWPVIRLLALRVECGGWPNPPSMRMLNDGASSLVQTRHNREPANITRTVNFHICRRRTRAVEVLLVSLRQIMRRGEAKGRKAGKCRCRKEIRTKVLESWIILGLFNASHMHTPWRYNRHFLY